ncbi:MAG: histidine phosphatase family protein [Armatimonadota bacterium]
MEELIVVRHGEAEHMVRGLTGGWTDTPLTEAGRKQALLTGDYLADIVAGRSVRLYASDLIRAAQTAEIIGESIGVKPILAAALRELNNGKAAGLTVEEAMNVANPPTEPLVDWAPFAGAETWRQMSERVESFLEEISGTSPEVTILVAHGGSGNAAICWWLRLEIGQHNISFQLDPCSVSRLNTTRYGERNVAKINDTAHLAGGY